MYVVRFVPAGRRADVATAARDAVTKVSAWLRAQFLLAASWALFAAVGLGALGVPYFYVVALVAALGETIPIVGPIIGGITAVAVASTVSAKLALGVGAFIPGAAPARGERAGARRSWRSASASARWP